MSIREWFYVIWRVAFVESEGPKLLPAATVATVQHALKRLSRKDVSYKSAWIWLQKLRQAMAPSVETPLSGGSASGPWRHRTLAHVTANGDADGKAFPGAERH
jgi:hypothetical protein